MDSDRDASREWNAGIEKGASAARTLREALVGRGLTPEETAYHLVGWFHGVLHEVFDADPDCGACMLRKARNPLQTRCRKIHTDTIQQERRDAHN
jgi:hypothetical protein